MGALFDPENYKKGNLKWPLVAHTVVMFSLVTVFTAISLDLESVSRVDNRNFPGEDLLSPGPVGYISFLSSEAIFIIPSIFLFLNNWLADGLLVSSV
jgi:hypothetical protein